MSSTKNLFQFLAAVICLAAVAPCSIAKPLWVDLYYPGWIQKTLTPNTIDYSKVTVVDNFAIIPNADGTLNTAANNVDDSFAAQLISEAHLAHRKVLITLGGESSGDSFASAVPDHEQDLIDNLMAYVQHLGYDGIDLDIEPIEHRDSNWTLIPADSPGRIAAYQQFVRDLRARMKATNPSLLLTAAVIADYAPVIFGPIQNQFDQINIMTYDMGGKWLGQTWYDGALEPSPAFPKMPSCDQKVTGYENTGVPKSKIGIGIMLDGLVWTGASKIGDPVANVTTAYVPLTKLMTEYFSKDYYHWDSTVENSTLSLPASSSPSGKQTLVCYEDIHSAGAKTEYCEKAGLGGIIIWQFGDGYQPGAKDQPVEDVLAVIQKAQK